jgi:hypothetical protein
MCFFNGLSHLLHLGVIAFTCLGWILPATRPLHLVISGLTLLSRFLLGPLIGQPGFCFSTGIQHRIWKRMGAPATGNYMSYLYGRLSGQAPSAQGVRWIDRVTQGVLYSTTLLGLLLI